jgi:magnesium chelatase family protein
MPGESRSSPREIQNYRSRISGPLLDRIDLHIEVSPVKCREITSEHISEAIHIARWNGNCGREAQPKLPMHLAPTDWVVIVVCLVC